MDVSSGVTELVLQVQWLESDKGWSLAGLGSDDLFRYFNYWYERQYPKPWVKVVDPLRVNPDSRSVDLKPRLALHAPIIAPMWGPHVTIIYPGRVVPKKPRQRWVERIEIGRQFHHLNHIHFWYLVTSPLDRLQSYRDEFQLGSPRSPFHLTVARLRES